MKALVVVSAVGALAGGVWVTISLVNGEWETAVLAFILTMGLVVFGGSVKL